MPPKPQRLPWYLLLPSPAATVVQSSLTISTSSPAVTVAQLSLTTPPAVVGTATLITTGTRTQVPVSGTSMQATPDEGQLPLDVPCK